MGHEVRMIAERDDADIPLRFSCWDLKDILRELAPEFVPDRLVVFDNSAPLMFRGFDEVDIPSVFFSVDAHHHADLHQHYGHIFDLVYVAQRDYLPQYVNDGVNAQWLPLWVTRKLTPSEEKRYQAVFIGNLDPNLNPERVTFFEDLKRKAPVLCQRGDFGEFFPYAEVVLNQTVKGDLNFRVFESMASGSPLLTERAPNGLLDLFREGEHLLCYTKNDTDDAAAKIRWVIEHPEEARAIGRRGREEVLRHHSAEVRAQKILNDLRNLTRSTSRKRHHSAALSHSIMIRRLLEIIPMVSAHYALAFERAILEAIAHGEDLTSSVTYFHVRGALDTDRVLEGTNRGTQLLEILSRAYPDNVLVAYVLIARYLDSNRTEEAARLGRSVGGGAPLEETYELARRVVNRLVE